MKGTIMRGENDGWVFLRRGGAFVPGRGAFVPSVYLR